MESRGSRKPPNLVGGSSQLGRRNYNGEGREMKKKIEEASLIYGAILALLFVLSLYIRVVLPYDSVFTSSFVRFGGNDPWYNMRLVENTLHNFPHRIYFDAFTGYPHGTNVPFAPLFDYLLAVIIWIIGLGNPYATLGEHGIEVIGAWYPAILGALTVIPVYFIGKELWNRNAGVISAALIAILPGQFLSRSLLGFTDHHVAETLFSTIAMLFFILAIKHAKANEITFYSVLDKDWKALRKPLLYSILSGLFLGSYYLAWIGAPLFIFVLLIYAVVQFIIDHVRGESTDYLCILSLPAFLISLLMIAPVLHPGALAGFHVLSLTLGMVVFGALSAVSFLMSYKKIEPYGYPLAILALGVLSLILLSILNPSLYSTLTGSLRIFVPSEAALTIAEVHPMHVFSPYTGRIADGEAWQWFTTTFFIAFAAFPWIGYNIARKFRPEEIFFLVWSAVMLFASFGQNRFAAYYAVNVALLCGFVSWKIIEFVGFGWWGKGGVVGTQRERKIKGKKKGGAGRVDVEKAKSYKTTPAHKGVSRTRAEKIKQYLRADIIITVLIIGLVVFYPPLNVSLSSARGGGGPPYDWYESLSWMKENTPDPGVDYYALYEEPGINETTNRMEDYDYPPEAYSVISWWDYGHWITRIAHRIPVANPFQQGIGGPHQGDNPGACVFFIAKDEAEANEVADALDVRYAVSDFMMADVWNSYYNKYTAMTVWAGDPQSYNTLSYYYRTMEARLHIFDGTSVDVEGENISALSHYRLVHESPTFILPMVIMNQTTGRGYWRSISGDYNRMESQARILHGYLFSMPLGMGVEDALDNGTIHSIMKSAFNSTGIPLSPDSTVVKSNENRWVIRDEINKNIFSINRKEGKLNVYLYGVSTGQPGMKAWTPEYIEPVSFVKVFEYVKGARIAGTAPNGSVVEVSTKITTNHGREFVYSQRLDSNGSYEFIVPYSTEGPIAGGTNFDVLAAPYTIRAGHLDSNGEMVWDVEKEISVPEEAVMEGKTISVDL
ncbi:MAG: oligosaccharyl transferase, archaeosortase A system-associated [Candidatus Methanospirareceae archaeon]